MCRKVYAVFADFRCRAGKILLYIVLSIRKKHRPYGKAREECRQQMLKYTSRWFLDVVLRLPFRQLIYEGGLLYEM